MSGLISASTRLSREAYLTVGSAAAPIAAPRRTRAEAVLRRPHSPSRASDRGNFSGVDGTFNSAARVRSGPSADAMRLSVQSGRTERRETRRSRSAVTAPASPPIGVRQASLTTAEDDAAP